MVLTAIMFESILFTSKYLSLFEGQAKKYNIMIQQYIKNKFDCDFSWRY